MDLTEICLARSLYDELKHIFRIIHRRTPKKSTTSIFQLELFFLKNHLKFPPYPSSIHEKNFSKHYIAGVLSHHQLVGLSQILCGNGRIQTPGDVHRLTALVLYVVRSPEIGIGRSRIADAIRLEFANKE